MTFTICFILLESQIVFATYFSPILKTGLRSKGFQMHVCSSDRFRFLALHTFSLDPNCHLKDYHHDQSRMHLFITSVTPLQTDKRPCFDSHIDRFLPIWDDFRLLPYYISSLFSRVAYGD